ncbi:MAG: hypothetical protein H0T79_22660 [Deltaproteobacteria bacterium]|nr:hypothetical protein [Deltaproteobacteria bacterium]
MSVLDRLREKNLHTWLRDYGRHLVRKARAPRPTGTRHIMFALCDHYEPFWRKPGEEVGRARVDAWHEQYPKLANEFRDSDGRPPRHGFFFPGEEYRAYFLDKLADLCHAGLGEVEVHLHHDGDTAETLAPQLEETLKLFAEHGHLSRVGNQYRWAFIHGNWCLANGRPDGKWCGVDDELPLLHKLGCYADLTFPAAPDPSQPDKVNQIYWPTGDLTQRRSYDHGERARVGTVHEDRLLMITGPLAFARKGRSGIRLENGALTGDDPPSKERVDTWIRAGIHIEGKPEWTFVKVHTHGAIEKTAASLLGAGGRAMHEALRGYMREGWKLHYVTAREMFNVARAAMDGQTGDPNEYFDYVIPPPPIAS